MMQPFQKADVKLPPMREWVAAQMKATAKHPNKPTRKELVTQYYALRGDQVWVNDTYQVNIDYDSEKNGALTPDPSIRVIHLSIKRRDKQPIMDYRDLMAIKDMLLSEDHEGMMLYPARMREHDMANQYHIWCPVLRDTGDPVGFPFGWNCGRKVNNEGFGGAVQRPFEEGQS